MRDSTERRLLSYRLASQLQTVRLAFSNNKENHSVHSREIFYIIDNKKMTEVRQAREVDMVPQELRFVPQVKSDIIIQRRNVSLAPIEAANEYTRNGTNTITFNIQGHRELSQLLDAKSVYFTWHCKFKNAYPVEDVSMLVEEVIISSNGRTLERIRHAQYIQHFLRGYGMSRKSKARLGKREGFQGVEDRTVQYYRNATDFGHLKGESTATAPYVDPGSANSADTIAGKYGYSDFVSGNPTDANATSWQYYTRMGDNLGYDKLQVAREAAGTNTNQQAGPPVVPGQWGTDSIATTAEAMGAYRLMKFRLPCSGILNCEKMLPIGWMPLTIQLRLSDTLRCTDSLQTKPGRNFDYMITRPRLHMNVCSVGQAYASAMQQRLRGPGITLNCKMFDTFFQIISSDKQIVIPSNKQRLSKVWVMFHPAGAATDASKNAFRSSVTGMESYKADLDGQGVNALKSYQFQVGTEVSEAVTLESDGGIGGLNNGMSYLEAYLRAIGAVNGHEQETEFWGRELDKDCNLWEGGDLLKTFLAKYFVCVYDGEKLLGSQIETGVDTESGKDIVVDLRWNGPAAGRNTRVMCLIQYHSQVVIKENSVDLSF